MCLLFIGVVQQILFYGPEVRGTIYSGQGKCKWTFVHLMKDHAENFLIVGDFEITGVNFPANLVIRKLFNGFFNRVLKLLEP